jgi:hypothetical protein
MTQAVSFAGSRDAFVRGNRVQVKTYGGDRRQVDPIMSHYRVHRGHASDAREAEPTSSELPEGNAATSSALPGMRAQTPHEISKDAT